MEEKIQLTKQLEEKQNDFIDYQNSSQQEIEMLHQKLIDVENERENLINENEMQNKEINQLKEDLYQFQTDGNIFLEEKKENDNKFDNLAQAFQIREQEYSVEFEKLQKMNQKLQIENENLKNKYQNKINLLTLQNKEACLRVRKLINTCISLKNYALSIERNINMNNSMFLGGNNYQGGNIQKNRDLLNGMNNIINQIDSKILNDDFLNQTH